MTVQRLSTSVRPIQTPFSGDSLLEFGFELVGQGHRHGRMIVALTLAIVISVMLFGLTTSFLPDIDEASAASVEFEQSNSGASGVARSQREMVSTVTSISSVYTDEVKRWEAQISNWSADFGLDPDLAAVIMQIESCGDPLALSSAGARGLFQVMPFHFGPGEDAFDPDTNARRGLAYFAERLQQTQGNVGLAFAGYNGGHVAAASGWDSWARETQDYYVWATGIYEEAKAGMNESPTLIRWLQSGGASLCRQASERTAFK